MLHGEASHAQAKFRGKDFWVRLPAVFVYPFKGSGLYIIIAGSIAFFIADALARHLSFSYLIVLRFVIQFLILGYLSAYILKIVGASAKGEEVPPDFPDVRDFYDDIAMPLFLIIGTFAFCFALAFVFYLIMDRLALSIIALVCGIFYFPMALTLVACNESLAALNPFLVLRTAFKIPLQYVAAVVFFFLAIGINAAATIFLKPGIPVIGGLVSWFMLLYCMLAAMNVLGTMYYCSEEKLT